MGCLKNQLENFSEPHGSESHRRKPLGRENISNVASVCNQRQMLVRSETASTDSQQPALSLTEYTIDVRLLSTLSFISVGNSYQPTCA